MDALRIAEADQPTSAQTMSRQTAPCRPSAAPFRPDNVPDASREFIMYIKLVVFIYNFTWQKLFLFDRVTKNRLTRKTGGQTWNGLVHPVPVWPLFLFPWQILFHWLETHTHLEKRKDTPDSVRRLTSLENGLSSRSRNDTLSHINRMKYHERPSLANHAHDHRKKGTDS